MVYTPKESWVWVVAYYENWVDHISIWEVSDIWNIDHDRSWLFMVNNKSQPWHFWYIKSVLHAFRNLRSDDNLPGSEFRGFWRWPERSWIFSWVWAFEKRIDSVLKIGEMKQNPNCNSGDRKRRDRMWYETNGWGCVTSNGICNQRVFKKWWYVSHAHLSIIQGRHICNR